MSEPIKHHYLPEFFLKRWADDDGKVTEFRVPRNDVHVQRKHPSETGYQRDLYTVALGKKRPPTRILESEMFSRIDNDAAKALEYMETEGKPPDDPELRASWTTFLMSMLHRSPAAVTRLRDRAAREMADIHKKMREDFPDSYPDQQKETGEGRLDALVHGGGAELFALVFSKVVNSERVGTGIFNMKWGVLKAVEKHHGFLTCDAPLLMSDGLGGPHAFILLTLGPSSYFVAANDLAVAKRFEMRPAKRLEAAVNDALAQQANELIVAADARQQRFIENRFGKVEPPKNRGGLPVWPLPDGWL